MGWCGNRVGSAQPAAEHAIAADGVVVPCDPQPAIGAARAIAGLIERVVITIDRFMRTSPVTTRAIVGFVAIVTFGIGFGRPATGDTLLNTINDGLQQDTAKFFPNAFLVMNSLFGVIGVGVVVLTLAEYVVTYRSAAGINRVFLRIILMIGVPWAILIAAQVALPDWYNLATNLGRSITGQPIAPNPDGVFATGAGLARAMLTVVGQKLYNDILQSGFNVAQAGVDIVLLIVAIVASMILFVTFTLLAVEVLVAFAQGYIGISVGAYQLGFSAAKATSGYATAYWGLVVSAFTRIFVTMAIIGVGLLEANKWIAQINAMGVVTDVNGFATSILTMLQIPLLGIAFLFLTTKVTEHAAAQLSGRPAYAGAGAAANSAQGALGGSAQGAIQGAMTGNPAAVATGAIGGGMRGAMSGSATSRGARSAR